MSTQPKGKKRDEQALPPTPEGGLKPVQIQRRRVWRACESCRRKKVKCDGNEPTCTQCASTGSQCTWLQTKDRAALSRHYVQELESRLIQMETLFAQVAPTLQQLGKLPPGIGPDGVLAIPSELSTHPGVAPAISQVLGSQDSRLSYGGSGGTSAGASPGATAIKAEDSDDDFSESQLAQDEHGALRWMGNSSTMSLIHSFRALTTDPQQRVQRVSPGDAEARGMAANKLYFPASVFFGKVRALPAPEEVEFPDRDLADKLVEAYFSRLHFLLPVIDKPSFLAKYQVLMGNTRDFATHRSETAFISLVFAVFACTARLVDDPRLRAKIGEHDEDGGMGMVYYERALILYYISHASVQVLHVQSFVLMASFLCSVNCLPQAWLLVGQAVRSGQDLGLHRSPRHLAISALEKEDRRKTWWGVYTMDRMLAVALGRPLGVDDSDCDVELCLPVDDDDLAAYFEGANVARERPALMTGFGSLVTLYKIGGRVLRQIYSIDVFMEDLDPGRQADLQRTVELLDQDLTKWSEELPAVFKSSPMNEQDVSMGAVLCSHYYSMLSTLHRNFLPINKERLPSPMSMKKAVQSAQACIHLAPTIKRVVPASHHLAFFIQNLFSSAVIIILYAMHASEPRAANAALDTARSAMGALEAWDGQWPGARKCRELLAELATTAVDAIRAGSRHPNRDAAPLPSPPLAAMGPPGLTLSTSMHRPVPGPSSPRSPTRWDQVPPSAGGKAVRTKPRRDRSHDPYTHSRQGSRSGASFREAIASRARSTSRRRPFDEGDSSDPAPYPSVLPYPAGVSSHSSPASAKSAGSPREPASDLHPAAAHAASPLSSPTYRMAQLPRPFDYSFAMGQQQQQPLPTPVSANVPPDAWGPLPPSTDASSLLYLPSTLPAQDPTSLYFASGAASADNGFYGGFDSLTDALGGLPGSVAGAIPNAGFAPGLPFPGLEYIRNYAADGGAPAGGGADDPLWQVIDSRSFNYAPDLPWALSDTPMPPIEEQQM